MLYPNLNSYVLLAFLFFVFGLEKLVIYKR